MNPPASADLDWAIEYPAEGEELFGNVATIQGWCFSSAHSIDRLVIGIGECAPAVAIHGYPRLDVAQAHPGIRNAFVSGFHGVLDLASLPPRDYQLTMEIVAGPLRHCVTRNVRVVRTPRTRISDVFVDIVGPCNIRCAMCPQGTIERRAGERGVGYMSVALFERVMHRLIDQGYHSGSVNLYNWGDPLLHPDLNGVLDVAVRLGFHPIVSTNLSHPWKRVEPLTRHHVALLLVSLSGFAESTYRRNHVGGNFGRVIENLCRLGDDRGFIREILMKYLVFSYNRDDIPVARQFAANRGFEFGAYAGAIPSTESFFRYLDDAEYRAATHAFIPEHSIKPTPSGFCTQESVVTVNHRGELELCCVSWSGAQPLSIFETSIERHLREKLRNQFCHRCMSTGYAYYKHFGIVDPELLPA